MRYWIKANQFILWCVARLFLIIVFSKRKVYLKSTSITSSHGYVIAANHQSKLDPFVIMGAMPFRLSNKLIPVSFMAHRQFFAFLPYRIFLQSWGAFPNKEIKDLEYGLPFSAKILANKGTIAIHPEGMRVKPGEQVEPRRGVAAMAAEPDVRLILVRIQWRRRKLFGLSVIVSEPRDCSGQTPQQIMDQIYALS